MRPQSTVHSLQSTARGACGIFPFHASPVLRSRATAEDGRITHYVLRSTFYVLRHSSRAFTLLELMIVVGIMGLVMLMGVPIVYKTFHKQPMTKAISEVMEVCKNARARSILTGQEVDMIIHPQERRLEISGGGGSGSAAAGEPFTGVSVGKSVNSTQLDDDVQIEDLDINLIPGGFRDAEVAHVRFFPNGTSDEMRLFLLFPDKNERCEIKLEVTTGLVDVEHNVNKFR